MTKPRSLTYDELLPHADRFWGFVSIPDDFMDCFPWQGGAIDGYGRFSLNGVEVPAHRVAYVLTAMMPGQILSSEVIVHHEVCDNPACCNPLHHLVCDYATNSRAMVDHGRFRGGRGHRLFTDEQAASIKERWSAGESYGALAAEFGTTSNTIKKLIHGKTYANVKPVARPNGFNPMPQGECNGNSKLDSKRVAQIKARLLEGATQLELAQEFGVAKSNISHIATGRTWKDVAPAA